MGEIADDCYDRAMEEALDGDEGYAGVYAPSRRTRCARCGSYDVRWRQQGGKWVLFSSKPGVEHSCAPAPSADGFGPIDENPG